MYNYPLTCIPFFPLPFFVASFNTDLCTLTENWLTVCSFKVQYRFGGFEAKA